jgi:ABC-type transport system involved in multi-copper enzyme maturation permease subunit
VRKLHVRWNPIIIKEFRYRMRGARAFIILTVFLMLLGLVSYGLYRVMAMVSDSYGGAPLLSAHVGLAIFTALALLELLLVCFITPALTAGIISGEQEHQTYEMLLVTPLPSYSILWGKFVSALVYVLLLIFAAVPMTSLVFIFGGVTVVDIVRVIAILLTTAVTFGAIGLFFSALLKRTIRATVITYAVIIALIVVPVLMYGLSGIIRQREPARAFLYLSPFAAMSSALPLTESGTGWLSSGPQALLFLPLLPSLFFRFTSGSAAETLTGLRPIWQYTMCLYVGLTVVFYLLSTQLIKPIRRWELGWREALLLGAIVLVYGGGSYAVYRRDGAAAWTAPPAPPTPAPQQVAVERVVRAVPPPAPPIPTPTAVESPMPTPTSFDAGEHKAALEEHLARRLLPADETSFCDVSILNSTVVEDTAEVSAWAYCRTFRAIDGELVSDLSVTVPVLAEFSWSTDEAWEIEAHEAGNLQELFPPELQRRLLETPYDEDAGEKRLWERARQALLEE